MLEADHFVSKTSAAELRSCLCALSFRRKEDQKFVSSQKNPQQICSVNLPENMSILVTVNLTPTTLHIIPGDKGFILNQKYLRAQCELLLCFPKLKNTRHCHVFHEELSSYRKKMVERQSNTCKKGHSFRCSRVQFILHYCKGILLLSRSILCFYWVILIFENRNSRKAEYSVKSPLVCFRLQQNSRSE